MNYSTWKLNFTNPDYGTGPEDAISKLGIQAEGSWVDGVTEEGGTILGYLSGPVDETVLGAWEVRNITQSEALDFCLFINEDAYLLPDGRITAPIEELEE
jgi:hypothetical protein